VLAREITALQSDGSAIERIDLFAAILPACRLPNSGCLFMFGAYANNDLTAVSSEQFGGKLGQIFKLPAT
jgi:hypothetical protein